MKKSPKPGKSKPKAAKKPSRAGELSEDDLERVSGGASSDYFLKLDGVQGESTVKLVPAVSVGNIGVTSQQKYFKLT